VRRNPQNCIKLTGKSSAVPLRPLNNSTDRIFRETHGKNRLGGRGQRRGSPEVFVAEWGVSGSAAAECSTRRWERAFSLFSFFNPFFCGFAAKLQSAERERWDGARSQKAALFSTEEVGRRVVNCYCHWGWAMKVTKSTDQWLFSVATLLACGRYAAWLATGPHEASRLHLVVSRWFLWFSLCPW
jgi:hypothetical protein